MHNSDAVELALSDSRFTIFKQLLKDNDLFNKLNTVEPYTIFAPTNEAFAKVDVSKFTKKELLKLLNTHIVTKRRILANEIESGVLKSPFVEIYLSKSSSGIFINGVSKVITPDILASNNVIHAIDKVVVPPTNNLLETIETDPNFSELFSLISVANDAFKERITQLSPFGMTMLAPTNKAFVELYKTIPKATLLADTKLLNELLPFQVISIQIFSPDIPNRKEPINTAVTPTLIGPPIASAGFPITESSGVTVTNSFKGQYQVIFDTTNSRLEVRGIKSGSANLINLNILATNGVIHAIDKVILP
jgi:uncharacterized surface protein with fasciclin (FAS1) repeats